MGAWIETKKLRKSLVDKNVAPHVGAWIETQVDLQTQNEETSLPTWERGLKHTLCSVLDLLARSLPTWERGLKHFQHVIVDVIACVAPHVGAWIETVPPIRLRRPAVSLPTWERGLKHLLVLP